MKNGARILFLLAVIMPLALFIFPIWRITLIAPQYPDGVNMYIWINKISGDTPATLQNINILNHYIGMKKIVPDEIPEFKIIPYVVLGLSVIGLIVVFINKSEFYLAWLVLTVILGIIGIYDFYLWEHSYGHNLDPHAPIKVPGMTYQPPLIGSKNLLNFLAISLPSTGALLFGLGILLGIFGWWKSKSKT